MGLGADQIFAAALDVDLGNGPTVILALAGITTNEGALATGNRALPRCYLDDHAPRSRNRVTSNDVSGVSFVSLHIGFVRSHPSWRSPIWLAKGLDQSPTTPGPASLNRKPSAEALLAPDQRIGRSVEAPEAAKGLGEFPTGVRGRTPRVVAQVRYLTTASRP